MALQFTAAEKTTLSRAARILEKAAKYNPEVFSKADQVMNFCSYRLADKEHEVFTVLFLDTMHQLIEAVDMFTGSINSATVHPREVAKKALELNAAAVIYAHNHPSGKAEPSSADREITKQLDNALSLFGINSLDHIVVGHGETVSFAQRGYL